jgi:chaperonin cofactor prefoldin
MTKKNHPKPTTLDDLAAMINHGFTETQKYMDKRLGGMDQRLDKMDRGLDDMKGVLKDVVQELNATHEDVRYIRTTVNLLVRNDVAQDAAIKTLSARVARLEKKVGLAN